MIKKSWNWQTLGNPQFVQYIYRYLAKVQWEQTLSMETIPKPKDTTCNFHNQDVVLGCMYTSEDALTIR